MAIKLFGNFYPELSKQITFKRIIMKTKIKTTFFALVMQLSTSATVFADTTGGYPFVASMSNFRLKQDNKCYGYVAGEYTCGVGITELSFVNDFFRMNTLAYGSSGQVRTSGNNPEFSAYGYAHAFFLKNSTGQPKTLDISIGSCNDVIMYTVQGRVKSGLLGDSAKLAYHRFPGNADGGKDCSCDDNLKPSNVTLPTGSFRLVVLTRGSTCSSYLQFPTDANNVPVNWINRHYLQVDKTNLDLFLK
jgi:hypothetical protein